MSIPDLDANFYSGPILKHVANIRQSVLVPHSISSNSIHQTLENEKTSYMKNSPSMKALESMLNNRRKPAVGSNNVGDIIEEEETGTVDASQKNLAALTPKLQNDGLLPPTFAANGSTASVNNGVDSSSVQSFQTATSVDMSPSKHTSKSTRTDGTGSSTYDETPELAQPAQFHTIKQTTKDFSPSIRVITAFQERRESAYSDHDATLIEADTKEEAPTPLLSQPTVSRLMIPDDILQEPPKSHSKPVQATQGSQSRPVAPSQPKAASQPPQQPAKMSTSATSPNLAREEPSHTRSSSSFSLSFNKNKDHPPIPTRHKRSSTLSDLTSKYFVKEPKTEPTTEKRKEPVKDEKRKKFSFKSLFKKKDAPRMPASASSPALAKTTQEPQSSLRNVFKKSKSTDTLSHLNEPKKSVDKQRKSVEVERQQKNSTPSESKSRKSLDTKSYKAPEQDTAQVEAPVKKLSDITNILKEQTNATRTPVLTKPPAINQGLIREVSDYDLNETYAYSDPEDEYDRYNISNDPPTPYNRGERIEHEIKLDTGFGSPFQVEYKSPQQIEDEADGRPKDLLDVKSQEQSQDNSQLLGETLFPKSLSAQEVQSIVSLERSRSIRSVHSKRNSFANYNGSDDNIQYNGTIAEPSSGIKRSESILKRAREEHLSPSPAPVSSQTEKKAEQQVEDKTAEDAIDLNDLIEFSDYIDFDNLDFDLSPFDATREASPALVVEEVPSAIPQSSPIIISSSVSVESLNEREREQPAPVQKEELVPAPIIVTESPGSLQDEFTAPLTPNLETIESYKIPSPPVLPEELGVVPRARDRAPGPRPISMSFRGSHTANFGDKLTMHEVRSSESHQLFNISLGDDSNGSESGVGDGFGGDSDELDSDLEDDLELEDKENIPILSMPPPKPLFMHKRISLWGTTDSHQSSPSSMNSFISRTFKRSPKVNMAKLVVPGVRFSSRIILYDTYNGDDYDRHPDTATCNQLTPALAQQIKEELNQVKSEMEVHRELRCNTHFF